MRLAGITAALDAVTAVSGSGPADYPETCQGPYIPSASDCAGLDYYGCCDGSGRIVYCQGGELYCIDCATLSPSCGWSPGKGYNCGQEPLPDPSWAHPMKCSFCNPPCSGGESCVDGTCAECAPDCEGKECGPDGCGGWCGDCVSGEWCGAGGACEAAVLCAEIVPIACGETVPGITGDGQNTHVSYSCSKHEFLRPEIAYTFTAEQDDLVILELAPPPGILTYMLVASGQCAAEACFESSVEYLSFSVAAATDYFVTVEPAPDADADADEPVDYTLTLKCQSSCVPDCDGRECGDDGCFSTCGDCAEQYGCLEGLCEVNDGCWNWELPGCHGCKCEQCVCEKDSWCCDLSWDALCVERCLTACGGCFAPEHCGDGACSADSEDCAKCPGDCPCEPPGVCLHGTCCLPDCEGKECGDDGCGGSCGECEPDPGYPEPAPPDHQEKTLDCGLQPEATGPEQTVPEPTPGKSSGGCRASHNHGWSAWRRLLVLSGLLVGRIRDPLQ